MNYFKYFILGFLFTIIGCGIDPTMPTYTLGVTVPTQAVSLAGYYLLPNGGYADVYEDAEGLYTIRSLRLVVVNTNSSTGLVPIVNSNPLPLVNGTTLYDMVSPNYVAATNNVCQDNTNNQLNGAVLTQLVITSVNGYLNIQVIISTPSTELFNHTVVSLNT